MKPIASILVLCAASVSAAVLLTACGGESSISGVRGASIVPASAAAFVAVDSDPDSDQWQNAMELSNRFPDKQDAVDNLEESLSEDGGVDFQTDVKPALGPELDFVWLDFKQDGENVVGLMQPDDLDAFKSFVEKANKEDPNDEVLYDELDDGWVVISDEQSKIDAFKRAVDGGGAVLADDKTFKQAMDDYKSESIFKAYVSGVPVMNELSDAVSDEDEEYIDKIGTLDWIALGLRTSSEGIRFDTTVRGTPGSLLRTDSETSSPEFELTLPGELPSDVLAYLAFHGVAGTLGDLENNPALRGEDMAELRSVLRRLGVLLDGEAALYARPSSGDVPEFTLVTQPREGTDGAAKLDEILRDVDADEELDSTEVAGIPTRKLPIEGDVALFYASVDDKLVISTERAGIEVIANPSSTLEDSGSFKDAVEASDMPDNVQSFFYMDIRGGLGLVEDLSGTPIPDEVKRNVKPLRSAVEYAAGRPSEVQLTFFVRIDEPSESSSTTGTTATTETETTS